MRVLLAIFSLMAGQACAEAPLQVPVTAPAAVFVAVGTDLSLAESFRLQVQRCWNTDGLSDAALQGEATLRVEFDALARPRFETIERIAQTGPNEPAMDELFQSARRALVRCGAAGYDLPLAEYSTWRLMELRFAPGDAVLR